MVFSLFTAIKEDLSEIFHIHVLDLNKGYISGLCEIGDRFFSERLIGQGLLQSMTTHARSIKEVPELLYSQLQSQREPELFLIRFVIYC